MRSEVAGSVRLIIASYKCMEVKVIEGLVLWLLFAW